ncbi:hypothetical protein AMS68_007349 [Peltaster fructicola]|uniref:Cytokinin riboside 5'-monophosphate phosphoribohydrolase n=1 Tax=Peltaster fructicola TaxID=286661 RepID=A0A6H0Y486_9PEZI|nr:hypothetical protein AMS68_007349 [Peltaster fructicola]
MSSPIKVCVFCGASSGRGDTHLQAARNLAKVFHNNNVHLVYGGGTSGIMGELAKTLVSLSGPDSVHGIIPKALLHYERKENEQEETDPEKLINKAQYGRTTVVKSMHARKKLMAKEVIAGGPGSGFVAMSGGYGTFEELLEMTTWNQLNIHKMPIVLFNVDGIYDGLLQTRDRAVELGFINESNRSIMVEAKTPEAVFQHLREYKLPEGRFNAEWSDGEE